MQHTVVNLLKMSWAPSNSQNFYTSYIVALDMFCCHCRRRSYLSGIELMQLCRVIQRSVNKADCFRRLLQWLGKKSDSRRKPSVKILIADTRLGIKNVF